MKNIITTIAFAVIALSVLPGCKKGCTPCTKTEIHQTSTKHDPVTKKPVKINKTIQVDKEEYQI